MAYPAHALLQFGGPRGTSGEEIWTCGIRMVPVGGSMPPDALQDYLEDVCIPALTAWITRTGSYVHSQAKLGFGKLNRISPDGTYADATTVATYLATPIAGSSFATDSAANMAQASLVLTWETATVARGLASKGRIYSPAPAVNVSAGTGLFPASVGLEVATSAAQLISDLRGTGDAGSMTPNIVSDGGAGVAHRIDRVSVDNKVDIIRKRAAQITATRGRVDVPA